MGALKTAGRAMVVPVDSFLSLYTLTRGRVAVKDWKIYNFLIFSLIAIFERLFMNMKTNINKILKEKEKNILFVGIEMNLSYLKIWACAYFKT